jgi:thioredoxin 1
MTESIIHTTDATFDRDITEAGMPVMVDFWAPWCAPCRTMGKTLDQVAPDYRDKVRILKVNVDDNPEVAGRFGIQSIPTLLFYTAGEPIGQIPGALPLEALREILDRHAEGKLGAGASRE